MHLVYCIQFTEYERGWGNRPDGWTLHKDLQSAQDYARDYNAKHNNKQTVPDAYTVPSEPYPVLLTDADYQHIFCIEVVVAFWGKGNVAPAPHSVATPR